jgi:ELWxxDGT repeat protein
LVVRLLTAAAAVVAAGALLGGALAPRGDAAATISAELVKNINPSGDSFPYDFTAIGTSFYFRANDAVHGMELWKSDGSASGTVMVKDINPGIGDSSPNYLVAIGTSLYFSANDGSHGNELWKSDGSASGTVMVKDINSGVGDSNPANLTALNGSLYFGATDGTNGYELWKSDGTGAGTSMVKDIYPGPSSSGPSHFAVIGTSLYFSADNGTNGVEIWKSDGSTAGTAMFKDINPGVDNSYPNFFTAVGTSFYFSANDGTNGYELWKSDGTGAGTSMVKDIYPGSASSGPAYFAVIGSNLYFGASDAVDGSELWKSDGSASGTVMVKDINPGVGNGNPYNLTAIGASLYFVVTDGSHGFELWKSDGSTAGTAMVADINPGSGDSNPDGLIVVNSHLFFQASDGTNGYQLWKAGDFSPPETQITSGPSGATADSTPTFTFSSDEAGTFQCSVDGGAMSACSSPSTLAALTDGAHIFRVRAIDSSANVDATPASRAFSVDTTAPNTRIASGPSGFVRTRRATFSFSSSETSSSFECKLDAAAWAACSSPKSYTGLSDRAHTFSVRATDQVGNVDASPAKRSFTVDTRAPQTKLAKHPKKIVLTKTVTTKASFTFTSSEKSSRFSCRLDKKKWKSCRSRTTYKLKPGKHTLQVRATDRAGNTDRTPAKWAWTLKRG